MFRFIDAYLEKWKIESHRKPLLLRGARQVGKTFAARNLGKKFKSYLEINFEKSPHLKPVFDGNLDPKRITQILTAEFEKPIIPGETLLFFDEIQEAPRALTALRYFYEEMPELHILAAGSLLHLAIEQVGVPVGRVSFCHVYPMTWLEFLYAIERIKLFEIILNHDSVNTAVDNFLHNTLCELLGEYMAIGGMPAVIQSWREEKNILRCEEIQQSIIDTYRNDIPKYAKKLQVKYVELMFEQTGLQLGQKFMFTQIPGEYRKRELLPALELLNKADLLHIIYSSNGQGVPIGAQRNLDKFKVISLDVGITQALLGLKLADWFIKPKENFINCGGLTEAFIGQELLAYQNPFRSQSLHYWQRSAKNSQAEIDYIVQSNNNIIPIEVKSNKGSTLKSLNLFLQTHVNSPYGVRFSTHNFSSHEKIHSYPLYAVSSFLKQQGLLQKI